jgi:hypothetical protein
VAKKSDDELIRKAMKLLSGRGASKGGKSRAERLSPERRKEIATSAAKARWSKRTLKGP